MSGISDPYDSGLYLLFPGKCLFCGSVTEQSIVCSNCEKQLHRRIDPSISLSYADAAFAPFTYEGVMVKAIHRYKFNRQRWMANGLADLIALCLDQRLHQMPDLISWVPVNFFRRMKRGYDQTMLLAKRIGRDFSVPVKRTLIKTRNTKPQFRMESPEMRRHNVKNVFSPFKGTDITGKTVLLIDDICTSGATMEECCRILLLAGAKGVICAALAKAGR